MKFLKYIRSLHTNIVMARNAVLLSPLPLDITSAGQDGGEGLFCETLWSLRRRPSPLRTREVGHGSISAGATLDSARWVDGPQE